MKRITILLAAMAALMLVPAAQAFAGTLTVNITGSGSGEVFGEVEAMEGPISCSYDGSSTSGTCEVGIIPAEEFHTSEEEAGGFAKAAEGSEFVGWTVQAGENAYPGTSCEDWEALTYQQWVSFYGGVLCAVFPESLGENVEITAEFAAEPVTEQPLTLKINEGEGTVVSDPAGLECTGAAVTTCEEEFEEGAEVTLTASPAAGYRFYNWPACPGTANGRQCTVTMSAAKEVRVNFKKSWQLTASKAAGSEPGIIKVLPTGVTCPYKCLSSSYEFLDGQEVTVDRYEPNGQLHFTEFTGGTGSAAACNGATTPCSFTLEADSSIEALFEANAQATLSLLKEGGGQAKITSAPAGIYCFNTCDQASSQFYSEPSAEEVTLSWTLGKGTSSLEWSTGAGTCTGLKTANGSCKVTMSAAKELVATLE